MCACNNLPKHVQGYQFVTYDNNYILIRFHEQGNMFILSPTLSKSLHMSQTSFNVCVYTCIFNNWIDWILKRLLTYPAIYM